ncbi:MAG: ATP-binding protein [Burkholderiaceae bacterium]|jgi:signal transduction histidine kinase|nr:ATP-binding protein [Burkholderiaceae bacterium]
MKPRTRTFVSWLIGLLLAALAFGVLGFLVVKSRSYDSQLRTDLVANLRDLREMNARLDVDVLRSRNGLNNDYDPLGENLQAIQSVNERLMAQAANARMDATALKNLADVFQQKLNVIDDFKATNAILLNSLRYLPTAMEDVEKNPQADADLRLRVNRVVADVFRASLLSDSINAQQVRAQLRQVIENVAITAGPESELAQIAQGFQLHALTILRQRETEVTLFEQLQAIPMRRQLDAAQSSLEAQFELRSEGSEMYRDFLAIYSAVLLLGLFYIAWRLAASYRLLARANRQLGEANAHLEQRVEERTHDLNRAMEDLKASEADLIQSEKMASLGQMVAGVAHEINTPLGYVRGTVEFMDGVMGGNIHPYCEQTRQLLQAMRKPDATEDEIHQNYETALASMENMDAQLTSDLQTALKNSLHGLDQISEIVLNLKNFSRLDRSRNTLYKVEDGIDSALLLAKQQVKHRKIVKMYGNTVPILCAPSQINQVMLNLITNAVQATTEENGTITITTTHKNADTIQIKVADNGKGIPEDQLGKIFDPFYTTKAIGQGTGLGLSIVYKIIEQHKGKIEVFSRPGVGTLFSIELPVGSADKNEPGAETTTSGELLLLDD